MMIDYLINLITNFFTISSILFILIFILYLKIINKNNSKFNTLNDMIEISFLYYSWVLSISRIVWYNSGINSNNGLCKMQGFLKIYSIYGLIINILILNLFMLKVIKNPNKIKNSLRTKFFIFNILLWSIFIILYFFDIFGYNKISKIKKECGFKDNNKIIFNIMIYGFYYIPLGSLIIITILITIKIRKYIKNYDNEIIDKIVNWIKIYPAFTIFAIIFNIILTILDNFGFEKILIFICLVKFINGIQGFIFLIIFLKKRKNNFINEKKKKVTVDTVDFWNSNLF